MTALVVLSVLWGVMLAGFLALMIYRSHLTNMETDQLFLSDSTGTAAVHQEQDLIIHRVQALAPFLRVVGIALVVLTLAVAVAWVLQVLLPQF